MGGILLIHGGADFAAQRLAEGRAYWSQALPVVLEKYGYLDVTSRGPEALERVGEWASYDIVLIAELPEGMLSDGILASAARLQVPVLVEGPVPPAVMAAVGVRDEGPMTGPITVRCTDPGLTSSAARFGSASEGHIAEAARERVAFHRATHWSELPLIPLGGPQVAAWSAPAPASRRWSIEGAPEVLAELSSPGGESSAPAIVRQGKLVACAFHLFGYLVAHHSAPPLPADQCSTHGPTLGSEQILLGLIDELYQAAAVPRARILPWPAPVRWVRTIRHDFERPLNIDQVRWYVAAHRRAGSAATWYWRAKPRRQVRTPPVEPRELVAAGLVAEQPGHEVALLAERLWSGAAGEREVVEAATGRAIAGVAVYEGRGDAFRWQGAPNVLWAERQGMEYTEMRGEAHAHPHRFPALRADGSIELLDVICLPQALPAESLATDASAVAELVAGTAAARGCIQISHNPDRDPAQLFDLLRRMPAAARVDWTAAQIADWWRRTHTGELRLAGHGNGTFELTALRAVDELAVEIMSPGGGISTLAVALAPGETRHISASETADG